MRTLLDLLQESDLIMLCNCQGPGSDFLTVLASSVLLQSFRHNFRAVFTTQILGTMIYFTVLMIEVLPIITPGLSVKSFVHEFQQYYDGQAPVYVEKFYRPGFRYYSGIAGIELS